MHRREFLIRGLRGGSLLVLLPLGWTVAGCSSSSGPTNGLRFTSSTVQGHTHDFTIGMVDLTTPPASGITGDTTAAVGHMHAVSLSQNDLSQIEGGQTVSKDTSTVSGHMHTFQFSSAAGASNGNSKDGGTSGGNSGGGY